MENIIVTGHRGYIGWILTRKLLKRGFNVTGIDLGLYDDYVYKFKNEKVEFEEIEKDVRELNAEDIEGADAIIHLAALSNDPLGELNPGLTMEINGKGSVRLAKLAKSVGVERFVFSSSCSVYGRLDEDEIADETHTTEPITEYAKSKLYAEEYISSLASEDFTPVYMRNATVHGYSPSLRLDLVVNNLTAWGFFTDKINILSDGRPWRPLIHVQDLSNVFIKMLEAPKDKVHNEVFNVGFTEENYQIKGIGKIIEEVIAEAELTIAKEYDPDSRSYHVDFKKLEKTIKPKRKWNVNKGAKELYLFFKQSEMSRKMFKNEIGARLNQLNPEELK